MDTIEKLRKEADALFKQDVLSAQDIARLQNIERRINRALLLNDN